MATNPTTQKTDAPTAEEAAQAAAAAEEARQEAERKAREAADAKAAAAAAKPPAAKITGKDSSEDVTTLKLANIMVRRNDVTTIPDTVFEHELPILRALHGEDFVTVRSIEDVQVANFDVNTEFARLKRKYKNPNAADRDVVGTVFGNDPRRLAELAGVPFKAGQARKPKQSMQKPAKKKVIGRKA